MTTPTTDQLNRIFSVLGSAAFQDADWSLVQALGNSKAAPTMRTVGMEMLGSCQTPTDIPQVMEAFALLALHIGIQTGTALAESEELETLLGKE